MIVFKFNLIVKINMSSFTMKSGQNQDIANPHKALLLSLLSVCMEETCKTALLYAVHHDRTEVDVDDMIRSLKYQLISEHGCGPQLKLHLKEAMETGTISDIENKPLAKEAVVRHFNTASDSILNNSTKKAQTSAMIDSIIGSMDDSKNAKDENGNDIDDEDGDDNVEDEDGDDNVDNTNEENDNDGDYECECDCDTCVEIDTIFGMEIEPSDDFEQMIMSNFQTILNKYK
jgi:hypothetical protein